MLRKTHLAILLLAAGAAAAPAVAGPDGRMGEGPRSLDFAALDLDGDGTLTRTELDSGATLRIAEADSDGDGILTRAEIVAAMPAPSAALANPFARPRGERMADRILAMTGEQDAGSIGIEALVEARSTRMLERFDRDEDGAISRDEVEARADPRGPHGEGRGRHGHGHDRS